LRKLSGKGLSSINQEEALERIKPLGYSSISSLLTEVGFGKLEADTAARKLLGLPVEKKKKKKAASLKSSVSIKVDGIDNLAVSLGRCCHPLPGDEVVGIVNSGQGIVIHTKDCIVARQVMESSPGKVLKVDFLPSDKLYLAKLRVSVIDKPGMLTAVSSVISKLNINIAEVKSRKVKDKSVMDFVLQVRSKDEFNQVLNAVRGVKGVISAKRVHREKPKKVVH